jgi:hypothetical protein
MQGETHGSSFSFLHADIQFFPGAFVKEASFSPSYVCGTFVKNQVGIAAWIHIWVFYSVQQVFLSVFVPVHAVFIAVVYSILLSQVL